MTFNRGYYDPEEGRGPDPLRIELPNGWILVYPDGDYEQTIWEDINGRPRGRRGKSGNLFKDLGL